MPEGVGQVEGLGMRVGSVGLTRARGLARLRTTPHVRLRFPGAV